MKNYLIPILILFLCACTENKNDATVPSNLKEYSIEQFMDNESIFGSSFSHDEKNLLVGSDKSGIYNAYKLNIESGEMTALTKSADKTIRPMSYFPKDDRFLFMSDNNGDEINHIFLSELDGSTKDLTPAEGARSSFRGWNKEKTAFYFSSNKRDPQFMDFYKMDISDFSSKLLYQNDEGFDLGGISNDEKYVTLSKVVDSNNNDFYVMDLASGKRTKINEELSASGIADFSLDSKHLYYTTNAGDEYTYVMKYDLDSGDKEKVRDEEWDIWYSYFSETGKYNVVGINADASTKLKIYNTETNKQIDFPDIEGKEISSVSISKSEEQMAFYAGSSNATSDLYIYNFTSGDYKKLTNTLNKEISEDHLVEGEVIRYKSFDGIEIPAILFKPHGASADKKVPAIVQVHGGPGGQSRNTYSSLYQFLVNHGYAVLRVNNRGSSGYGKTFNSLDDLNHGEGDLQDCIEGKNYLAGLDWVDKDNIGILGGSYGGYMTMRAMTAAPEEFKVGVNIFGVTNWIRTLKSIPPWWESFKVGLYAELGDPNTQDSVRLYEISPLFHADKIKNPVMVLQGATDPRVLQVESDEMVEEMKKNGVEVEYVLFEDEGHGFRKKENQIEGWSKILGFLDSHLKEELVD